MLFFHVVVCIVSFLSLLIFIFFWVKFSFVLFVVDWLWMFGVFCSDYGSLIGKISKSIGVYGMLCENLSKFAFFFQETKEVDNLLAFVLF